MENTEQAYIALQRHLDRQPIGLPATRSGAEIKILKHIFTPREARIATCLTHRSEPIEKIYERAGQLVKSEKELEGMLDQIENKGGIEVKVKDGRKLYRNAPLVVGMYENQTDRLTPEFIKNFDEYTSDKKFGVEFLSTKLPQMRTIPISKSITPQHEVSTFDQVSQLLQTAEAPYVILECICRKKKELLGKPCKVTDRKETCFAVGHMAEAVLKRGDGREITLEESLALLKKNQKQGMVLQPSNAQKAEFICSCCGCCCGLLSMQKNSPKPVDFWAANFYAVVDTEACDGCGNCEKRCQVDAATVAEEEEKAAVNLDRCIGCGLCVPTCPKDAIHLEKKPLETKPPRDREELLEIIKENKKGKLV